MFWTQSLSIALVLLLQGFLCKQPLALGLNKVAGKLPNGSSFEADLTVARYDSKTDGQFFDDGSWWGAIDEPPARVLREVVLLIDGRRAEFRHGAYAFLADPDCFRIQRDGGRIKISVRGGDGGASYTAHFTFRDGHLIERAIHSDEFPDDIYEITKYVNTAPDL